MTILNRRSMVLGSLALSATASCAKPLAMDLSLFIGAYNDGDTRGIYPLTYTADTDSWSLGAVMPAAENVSFAVYSPRFDKHYLLNEKDEGTVDVWTSKAGVWSRVGQASTQGAWPCYAALSRDEGALAVANYGAGNILVYPLDAEGRPTEPVVRQNTGSGPNKDRQEGPHAHWVQFAPDQKHIHSIDLGTDEVLGFSYAPATNAVGEKFIAFKGPAGSGPRHMAWHPGGEVAFLVTELDNRLISLKANPDGTFSEITQVLTLPEGFSGRSFIAHIAVNAAGNRVYVSNRGHNSIAVFETDGQGALTLLQIESTQGDWPRFFALFEAQKRLVVAHQNSNDLVVFTVNDRGTLTPRGQKLVVPRPVFLGQV